MVQKYACMFVLEHYLFLKAHSFPSAPVRKLFPNKYSYIFACQMAAIVAIHGVQRNLPSVEL